MANNLTAYSGDSRGDTADGEFAYISDNYRVILDKIGEASVGAGRDPADIRVMAVTKTQPSAKIRYAEKLGLRLFGENRVQELLSRIDEYSENAEVHFIGGLQRNKVRQIIGRVAVIQSLDKAELAAEIDKQAAACGVIADCLIEINVGGEDGKNGVAPSGVYDLIRCIAEFSNIRLRGVMTIPPPQVVSGGNISYFKRAYDIFGEMRGIVADKSVFDMVSMGMSDDYAEAVACGATVVRIGTALFGRRDYT